MPKKFLICFIIISFLTVLISGCLEDVLLFPEIDFSVSSHILRGYFVKAIDFDSQGNAWIGTFKQGVIEYNNGITTKFDSKNSLIPDDAVIRDIKVDNNDNIWIGTYGLVRHDGGRFEFYNTANSPILEDIVWSIGIDSKNKLWLATSRHKQGGLTTFDGANWETFTPENSALPGNGVMEIVIDNQDNIWLGMNETVYGSAFVKINNNSWEIYSGQKIGISLYWFGNLAIGKNDMLIASMNYMLSSSVDINRPNIITFDGSCWEINNPVDERGNSLGYVGVVNTDTEGNIWAAIDGNATLAVYNGRKWYYTELETEGIFTIESDPQGRIWIGTGDGIFIIDN